MTDRYPLVHGTRGSSVLVDSGTLQLRQPAAAAGVLRRYTFGFGGPAGYTMGEHSTLSKHSVG